LRGPSVLRFLGLLGQTQAPAGGRADEVQHQSDGQQPIEQKGKKCAQQGALAAGGLSHCHHQGNV